MSIKTRTIDLIAEILDLDSDEIQASNYMVRDLDVESIDLLELAVEINSEFQIKIDETQAFLKSLRLIIKEAENKSKDIMATLSETYPYLDEKRIKEIIKQLENGPVLKVQDIIAYIKHQVA